MSAVDANRLASLSSYGLMVRPRLHYGFVKRAPRTPAQQIAASYFWGKFTSKSSMEATR